jgi:hypothetical protein
MRLNFFDAMELSDLLREFTQYEEGTSKRFIRVINYQYKHIKKGIIKMLNEGVINPRFLSAASTILY